jgi:hypothetical protein
MTIEDAGTIAPDVLWFQLPACRGKITSLASIWSAAPRRLAPMF